MARGYGPKLPLTPDPGDGIAMNKSFREQVRQNVRMILLTSPGERILYPDFGAGIYDILFEQNTVEAVSEARGRIFEQLARWAPYIELDPQEGLLVDVDEATGVVVAIRIKYYVTTTGIQDNIVLNSEEFLIDGR